jgi:hypothetical protein
MQFLWQHFRRLWQGVRKRFKRVRLTVRWVLGHEGVQGNEEADRMAKRAIAQGSSIESRLPRCLRKKIPVNRQAVAQRIHASLKKRATRIWNASPRAERLRKIDKSLPSDSYLKLIAGLPRNRAAMLTQLRTGHIPLQAYLHRIQVTDSATCPGCKRERETVMHFLMQCPSWAAQRRLLVAEAGPAA